MENYNKSIILLLKRLLYLVIAYSLTRMFFLAYLWGRFNDVTISAFVGGIRFDLSVIFYTNILVILGHVIPGNFKYTNTYQKGLKYIYFISNAIFLTTNFVDCVYYNFTAKRSTFDLITADGMEQEIMGLLPSYLQQFWPVLIAGILFLIAFWKGIPNQHFKPRKTATLHIVLKQLAACILLLGLTVLVGRGGTQRKPLKRVDAIKYAPSKNTPIVLNTPFCILKTIGKKKGLRLLPYFSDAELTKQFNPQKQFKKDSAFIKKNIAVIILESFGDENISYSNPTHGNTPFLDSLIHKSLYFKNGFANGRVSIDAVPSVISGIPSIFGEPYIASNYAFNTIEGLPSILNKEGYHTSFFHGAFNGSQNFDQYASIARIKHYFGKDEYPNPNPKHLDGKWGVFDEEYLQFFGEQLSQFKEPFFSSVFTISSHMPFVMPQKHAHKFKNGPGKYNQTVGYTDYALKQFFNYAKQQKWYNNTLFVITADHCSSGEKGYFKSKLQEYEVPIIFFDPSNNKLQGKPKKNLQQIDIMPSILDYLNYTEKFISYGNSFLEEQSLIVNYINNAYHVIINDDYFIFDETRIIELYHFKKDPKLTRNLVQENKKHTAYLEKRIKAYLQSFHSNIIHNTFTVAD